MEIIKNGRVEQSDWIHLADDEALPASTSTGLITLSSDRWIAQRESSLIQPETYGIRLTGDQSLEPLLHDLHSLPLIVIEFPVMADGRGFSTARLLRDRYGYQGEIRAYGQFIPDQLQFMSRCGINSFEFQPARELESILPLLSEFTLAYQAASDVSSPHYLRPSGYALR